MKRILTVLLAVLLCICVAACVANVNAQTADPTEQDSAQTTAAPILEPVTGPIGGIEHPTVGDVVPHPDEMPDPPEYDYSVPPDEFPGARIETHDK